MAVLPDLAADNDQRPLLGLGYMLVASAAFTVMITLVKFAREDYGLSAFELMFWRSVLGLPIVALAAVGRPHIGDVRMLALRVAFGFAAMFCHFSAARWLSIGQVTVVLKLQPLLMAVIAPRVFGAKESAGAGLWVALALGLAGTIGIALPSMGDGGSLVGFAFGLGAACCGAAAHVALRGLKGEDPGSIVFWFQLSVGFAALAAIGASPEIELALPADRGRWLLLVGIGITAAIGQLSVTRAYASDRAARVAVAGYAEPLLGFAVDVFLLGLVPAPVALLGGLAIIASGLVVLRRG